MRSWLWRGGATLVFGLTVAGCAGAVGAGLPGLLGVLMLVVALVACSDPAANATGDSTTAGEVSAETFVGDGGGGDATIPDAAGDSSQECEGAWETCCVNGAVSQCCCPPQTACNYGWFEMCDDGTCTNDFQCPGADAIEPPDTAVPDADPADTPGPEDVADLPDAGCDGEGGGWESCCLDGKVSQCCCPAGTECNYGWYDLCTDGSCAFPGGCTADSDAGPAPDVAVDAGPIDAGPVDAGPTNDVDPADGASSDAGAFDAGQAVDAGCDGYWEPCCIDGHISTCCCPNGVACNYGWFQTCPGGGCTFPGGTCPEDQ